jgi:hypothetical protein
MDKSGKNRNAKEMHQIWCPGFKKHNNVGRNKRKAEWSKEKGVTFFDVGIESNRLDSNQDFRECFTTNNGSESMGFQEIQTVRIFTWNPRFVVESGSEALDLTFNPMNAWYASAYTGYDSQVRIKSWESLSWLGWTYGQH